MNSIAVDVEVSIVGGANGIPFSFFDPNHPFVHRNFHSPLPYWAYENKFHSPNQSITNFSLIIEENLTITPPSLDLKKAFNCFNQIPSNGAKYTIKLCADVPNNKNPLLLSANIDSETGHSFLVVTKKNGEKTISQVFGFYAYKHPGYFFPFRSLPSVIKNNQLREINASIEMPLTEVQFDLLRKKAFELAKQKYAAASYNCTNYALDLFNSLRTNPITIETCIVYLPANVNIWGMTTGPERIIINKTPQMLFKKLKEMKGAKNSEAPYIAIDTTENTKAPLSHGECN